MNILRFIVDHRAGFFALVCFALFCSSAPASAADPPTEKACCAGPYFGALCDDGSKPRGLFSDCCGVGKCNIFCCNCDGGCKQAHTPEQRKAACNRRCEAKDSICSNGCNISCSVGTGQSSCMRACQGGCRKENDACKSRCNKLGHTEPSPDDASSAIFKKFDGDNDDSITIEEFRATVTQENLAVDADQEFMSLDKDQDGLISLEEACVTPPEDPPLE